MVEPVPAPRLDERYYGIPNWEEVKHTIYGYWVDANHALFVVDLTRVQDTKLKSFGKAEDQFKAGVLRLFRAVRSKLWYHKEAKCVRELSVGCKDGEYVLDAFLERPSDLAFLKAVGYFLLLSDFLELDGVTRFEKKEFDPRHGLASGLE